MENGNRHIDIDLLTRSIAGETSPEEQETVQAWLSDSEANREEYERLKQTWDLLGNTDPSHEIDLEAEWKYHQGLISGKGASKGQPLISAFVRIAAAILIVFGMGVLGLRYFTTETIKTDIAGTEVVTLPDGTRVTLNAGSKLSYSKKYAQENRQVALKGEGYFEVEKDANHPFIIEIGEAEIKVLGTEFNVRAYDEMERVEVTVTEGTVSIYAQKQTENQVIATGGEKAEYNRSEMTVRKIEITNRNYLSWKTRLLIFEDDNLSVVAKTISETYHKEVRLRDTNLNNCKLTTRFEEKDLETVLLVLESTFDISREEEKDVIYLSGMGCE